MVIFETVRPWAKLGGYRTPGAIGCDLLAYVKRCDSTNNRIRLDPGRRVGVSTGIKMAIPEGYYGRIAPKSGLAVKHGIDVLAGVIDADYRGEIIVLLHNTSNIPYYIDHGQAIAQIVFERAERLPLVKGDVGTTERGEGGFGSTGV